jgi:hypothetical protein
MDASRIRWPPDGDDKAHDVLAAEEFAIPTEDPTLHHAPVELPENPTGIAEPHDVLAAEDFPMPAAPPHAWEETVAPPPASPLPKLALALGLLLGLLVVRRLLRRG